MGEGGGEGEVEAWVDGSAEYGDCYEGDEEEEEDKKEVGEGEKELGGGRGHGRG